MCRLCATLATGRLGMANRILGGSGLRLEPADGHYVLADKAGGRAAVAEWGEVGEAARLLTGRGLEPLALALMARLETT